MLILGVVGLEVCGASADAAADYTAHEWGTFTSVQGSDGEPIPWNPFQGPSDLPAFVFRRQVPTLNAEVLCKRAGDFRALGMKDDGAWLQRMETPVIYFHSRKALDVDVHVRFPNGLLTEWFPQVTTFGPVAGVNEVMANSDESHLRWNRVRVMAKSSAWKPDAAGELPTMDGKSHYYAARQTSANVVEARSGFAKESQPQRDRFLFYRGAGSFAAPLRVGVEADDRTLLLANRGDEPLGPLFAVKVAQGKTWFSPVPTLAPREQRTWAIPSEGEGNSGEGLASALRRALETAGLHADEAAAMVATWQEAWFQETGLRVLYLLPQAWTDRTLPLTLVPPPRSLVRVMVGRAEVFSRATESRIASAVSDFMNLDRDWSVATLRTMGMGRFLEPSIRRAGRVIQRRAMDSLFSCQLQPAPDRSSEMSLISEQDWARKIQEVMDAVRRAETEENRVAAAVR